MASLVQFPWSNIMTPK